MSTIISANVSDGTLSIPTTFVTNGSAKAWVRYNGVSATIADSLNTASLTDLGVGDFQFSRTSAMANQNYVVSVGQYLYASGSPTHAAEGNPLTTSNRMFTFTFNVSAAFDTTINLFSIHGDLA
jgi:hypothetical protein